MNKQNDSLLLKADLMPLTVLKLKHSNIHEIRLELEQRIKQAPQYFVNAPIVIDINDVSTKEQMNLAELCDALKSCQIIPVGIKGLAKKNQQKAIDQGLAIVNSSNTKKSQDNTSKPVTEKESRIKRPYKLVTKTVRSGTQVYAKNTDLVILAAVNTGAEVIADGNIHIYGPLRGRALAGARGDEQARIFCENCDAELVSIAGHYLIKENLKVPRSKKPLVQIYLNNNKITIEGI
jgi:septum site-determining protein MinC